MGWGGTRENIWNRVQKRWGEGENGCKFRLKLRALGERRKVHLRLCLLSIEFEERSIHDPLLGLLPLEYGGEQLLEWIQLPTCIQP